jgi:hypothetical protein
MMEIRWHPTRRDLQVFSALLILFSAIVAGIVAARTGSRQWPWGIALGGLLVGTLGLLQPTAIRWFYLAWMVAVFPIGWVVSHVILGTIYFGVFTPIGCLLRWTGHDRLHRRRESGRESYWEPHRGERPPSDYFRQF